MEAPTTPRRSWRSTWAATGRRRRRAFHGLPRRRPPRRPAVLRRRRRGRRAADAERAGQPDRLPPALAKLAIVKSPEARSSGSCARGATRRGVGRDQPFGKDAASGDHVHLADFSTWKTPGSGYTLKVGGDVEPPVRHPQATSTRSSSTTRSPTSIRTAAASRSRCPTPASRSGRARPATQRPAQPRRQERPLRARTRGCNYSLDVTGGWYDAGDHGQVRRQRRHLGVDAARTSASAPTPSARRRRLRRRQAEHPREQEQGARPARRGALGAGVRC